MSTRKLFCQRNRLFYKISLIKEYLRRDLKELFSGKKFARKKSVEKLPNIVKGHRSLIVRKLQGVDLRLQYNKVKNLELASSKINGLIIHPGEVFSFWKTVKNATKRKGYLEGLVISNHKSFAGIGGGLCQLANMVHWLILNSPLSVTEIHHHSDALFPDEQRRVPFGTGTSIFYKNLDYQFKNTSNQDVQLLVWVDGDDLCGELRSETPFPFRYKIVEENNHFVKENFASDAECTYYRISQIYRITIDRTTNEEISKELILSNHSEVMYDPSLIPKDQVLKE